MKYADQIPSRLIKINNEDYLYFGGTAYLGIHANPDFGKLVVEGINLYGTNYGASRLGVGIPVFDQMESKLATWLTAPSSVIVSSGTLAGRLIIEALGDDYAFHSLPNAHVAINPNFKNNRHDLISNSIEDTLDAIHLSDIDKHVITFNTIDALTSTITPMDWLVRLPKDKEIILIQDDSHGIGVLGEEGSGAYAEIKKLHSKTIMIASLGKAMGLPAGIIAGPIEYTSLVKRHALFGGSSPMVPAYAHAYLYADEIYHQAYAQLKLNTEYFKERISHLGLFTCTDHFPIFCTDRHELAPYLEMNKIKISHFAYPSPKDRLYTRIVIHALHTKEDMDRLIQSLENFTFH